MESIARARLIRTSPQKLGLVINMIKGMSAYEAALQLQYSKKAVAKDVKSVLDSAIANAENNYGMDIDNLYIKEVYCGKSITMKRFSARARGRASRILKTSSNLTIVLSEIGEN